jgi:hypothetical protein
MINMIYINELELKSYPILINLNTQQLKRTTIKILKLPNRIKSHRKHIK